MFNTAPFCIASLDETGAIATANRRFEEHMGPLTTLKGVGFVTALVGKDIMEEFAAAVTACRTDGSPQQLCDVDTLVLVEGMPMYRRFNWSLGVWDTPGSVALYGTMTTVVDAEKRERETEFVDFFDNAPIALHWLSDTGHVLWANKTEMSVLGYTPEEYIGANIMNFCPDDEALVLEIFKALGTGNTIKDCPVRFRTKAGKLVHLLIDSNVNYKPDGSFNHTRCFIRDDTSRKIKDARTLVAAEEAQRSIQQLDGFIYKAFHTLRTPCHIVAQLLASLRESLMDLPNMPEEGEKVLEMVVRSANGLLSVLDDATYASRFEHGLTVQPRSETLSLFALAHGVVSSLKHSQFSLKEGVELKIDLSGDGPRTVQGDYRLLHRVLYHLVENAVKATSQGEIVISIRSDGLQCQFEVSDTGHGIPGGEEAIRAVFQRYWQTPPGQSPMQEFDITGCGSDIQEIRRNLDKTLQGGAQGLGLGLNVCFNLVQCMGGVLSAVSGDASTSFNFCLNMPVAAGHAVLPALGDQTAEAPPAMEVDAKTDLAGYQWAAEALPASGTKSGKDSGSFSDAFDAKAQASNESATFSDAFMEPGDDPASFSDAFEEEAAPNTSCKRGRSALSNETIVSQGVFNAGRVVHVLLAVHNTRHQRLLTQQLQGLGCTVEVASNGQAALDKLSAHAFQGFYDLAFMELSLPLMSGREAVAELSKSPDMMLPVIAIANDADAAGLQQDGFAGVVCETSGTHELLKVVQQHVCSEWCPKAARVH